jgi:preprotein translocase subunit YajC
MLLIWGAVFVGMWFLMIRPQRKREKAMKELQAGIGTGDDVITSGGLFGKVADVGEDCFIVEFGTNRGLRVPVLKADVVARRTPKMTPQPKEE